MCSLFVLSGLISRLFSLPRRRRRRFEEEKKKKKKEKNDRRRARDDRDDDDALFRCHDALFRMRRAG